MPSRNLISRVSRPVPVSKIAPCFLINPWAAIRSQAPVSRRMALPIGSRDSPIWKRGNFSFSTTSTRSPCFRAKAAAVLPPGPPPTTITSKSGAAMPGEDDWRAIATASLGSGRADQPEDGGILAPVEEGGTVVAAHRPGGEGQRQQGRNPRQPPDTRRRRQGPAAVAPQQEGGAGGEHAVKDEKAQGEAGDGDDAPVLGVDGVEAEHPEQDRRDQDVG